MGFVDLDLLGRVSWQCWWLPFAMGICWCFVVCLLLFGGWGDLCFSCWLLLVVVYCACGSCVLVVDVMGFVACC